MTAGSLGCGNESGVGGDGLRDRDGLSDANAAGVGNNLRIRNRPAGPYERGGGSVRDRERLPCGRRRLP